MPSGGALCSLSVRSGFDAYLEALALPKGAEMLMSALNIPGMWAIVEEHGLVPVPVDVDPRTLAPRIDSVERAASPRTRALLVAHLFGTRVPLGPYAEIARRRGWLLLEDCAQAFAGTGLGGDPLADVSMFSFGPIKTATALGGAVLCVRDRTILDKMRALQVGWPMQSRGAFAARVLKYAALKLLSVPAIYGVFAAACGLVGADVDRAIHGSVRGFGGRDFFGAIRKQPSAPLCALLARRLEASGAACVAARTEAGLTLRRALGEAVEIVGGEAPRHSYWVFAIQADDRARLIAELRTRGFDATAVASLAAVPAPAGREDLEAREANRLLARMVYLPAYPELPRSKLAYLAESVRAASPSLASGDSNDLRREARA